jgi:hypothetical protein
MWLTQVFYRANISPGQFFDPERLACLDGVRRDQVGANPNSGCSGG